MKPFCKVLFLAVPLAVAGCLAETDKPCPQCENAEPTDTAEQADILGLPHQPHGRVVDDGMLELSAILQEIGVMAR